MKVALFAPYGHLSPESGLLYTMGRYLGRYSDQVSQLHCNGAFALCARDRLLAARRTPLTCPRCRGEQQSYSEWSEATPLELTHYLAPEVITGTRRLIMESHSAELVQCGWKGTVLFELARHEAFARLDGQPPALQRPDHEQLVRQLLLSAARALSASSRFIEEWKPSLALVAGGEDVLSRSFVEALLRADVPLVLFQADSESDVVRAIHPGLGKVWSCELALKNLLSLPSAPEKWPADLLLAMEDLALSFGLVDAQLALPLAR